ncbi:MAG: LuxR C-terminal-related transcriptional regulator [Aquabacterium sp.]|nr:LuxR C-terminal-related transcriptional regulator [Aquabacterium sp.]
MHTTLAERVQRTAPVWPAGRAVAQLPLAGTLTGQPWLQVLDLLDIGVLIVDAHCEVQHANAAALAANQGGGALKFHNGRLQLGPATRDKLEALVRGALRGQWAMLAPTPPEQPCAVAVVPLLGLSADRAPAVALLMGGDGRPSRLALQFFKQNHGLTPAEAAVLDALCEGLKPAQIASAGKVAVCTVRSQISAVRNKTGARSIGHLLRMVSGLPPITRHAAPQLA